ncbi:PIR protein [Plasmodium yoelii yoelii]|uniref:PIR protein n=3 Tax=Plasmodium yoelii TaxID=5861 RepID=A0AAF0B7L9_PLAYO|nr:PIR protein [Plasmodium yoelii yoelii]WBY59635.1 PIR protein [Plasmodium yoelii yoelii]
MYLPDELKDKGKFELEDISNYNNYCPNRDCNSELEKITIGFLWLLGEYFTKYPKKGKSEYMNKPFFLYIVLWLSHKLNQNSEYRTTQISDFYTKNVIGSNKYSMFKNDSNRFTDYREFIDKQINLLNINIEDLSKFYDAFKLLCSIYDNTEMDTDRNTLLNNASKFVIKYQELKRDSSNSDDSPYKKILSVLSNDYDYLKNKCKHVQPIPDIEADISALAFTFEDASSSSPMGSKLFTVLSIFGAIAFFLGISYKYSLFGFRKRAQKQYLREKIKKIKKKMNH